jgi:hypothetical protein
MCQGHACSSEVTEAIEFIAGIFITLLSKHQVILMKIAPSDSAY